KERLRKANLPPGQRISDQEKNLIAGAVLNELVERSMILQEARRELKDPKKLKQFMGIADDAWLDDELPPLLRKYAVTNIYELTEKLKEQGQSLDEIRETYRTNRLAQDFMRSKLGSKMTVSLPEMRDYYNAHLKEFDRPAQVTWREIEIDVNKCRSR